MKRLRIINQVELASEQEIAGFEQSYSIRLPMDFREYLKSVNAISILESLYIKDNLEFWVSDFYPLSIEVSLSLQFVYDSLLNFFESKYIAFAGDAGGWQFVISLRKKDYGKVYFCRMDEELEDALTLLADSFEEFVDGLESAPIE